MDMKRSAGQVGHLFDEDDKMEDTMENDNLDINLSNSCN